MYLRQFQHFLSLVDNPYDSGIASKKIIEEVDEAKKTFKKYNWPVIDVTRKSVEETAASVIKILDITKNK